MTDEARMGAMKEIVDLPEAPYDDPALVAFCHQEHHRLAAKLGVAPALGPAPAMLVPSAPSQKAWIPDRLRHAVARVQAAPVTRTKRRVGRPRDPREALRLVFYMEVSLFTTHLAIACSYDA